MNHAPSPLRAAAAALLLPLLCAATARADKMDLRVIGFSAPEREKDFALTMEKMPDLRAIALDAEHARVTLEFNPADLFPKVKVPSDPAAILKRINDLTGAASLRTFQFATPSGLAEDTLAKVEIKVGLLDCKSCRYAFYSAVAGIDGVERATVHSTAGVLTAWIDPQKTSKDALFQALKKLKGVELPPQ